MGVYQRAPIQPQVTGTVRLLMRLDFLGRKGLKRTGHIPDPAPAQTPAAKSLRRISRSILENHRTQRNPPKVVDFSSVRPVASVTTKRIDVGPDTLVTNGEYSVENGIPFRYH